MRNFESTRSLPMSAVVIATFLFAVSALLAQPQQPTIDQFAGSYKGTAKSPTRDLSLMLEMKIDSGKITGRLVESTTEHKVTDGEFDGDKLVLHIQGPTGAERLTLEKRDGKLVGEWVIASGEWTSTGGKPGLIQFDRVPAAGDEISGEWDAVADAQGEAFPFTLTLRLDGERIAGSSSSQLGTSQVSTGIWKDGRLSVVLDSATGPIGLVATMTDGKLVGDYDYAGQLQGKWVAVRRK